MMVHFAQIWAFVKPMLGLAQFFVLFEKGLHSEEKCVL